jgi:hypothetical protein
MSKQHCTINNHYHINNVQGEKSKLLNYRYACTDKYNIENLMSVKKEKKNKLKSSIFETTPKKPITTFLFSYTDMAKCKKKHHEIGRCG